MPDVVTLLTAPPPWDEHDTGTQLPPEHGAILGSWPGTPAELFRTCGPVDAVIEASGIASPGSGGATDARTLTPGDLATLQAELDAIAAAGRPAVVRLGGRSAGTAASASRMSRTSRSTSRPPPSTSPKPPRR